MKPKKVLSVWIASLIMAETAFSGNLFTARADSANSPAMPSRVPGGLAVLSQSVDDTGLTLVWSKPAQYSGISDYNVYENGVKIGDANHNGMAPAQKYSDRFYSDAANSTAVKTSEHNYIVTGLSPSTTYTFTVKAVDASGAETDEGSAYTVSAATLAAPATIDVTDYGAIGDGAQSHAAANTTAIQNAVNACAKDGKVVVPAGKTFVCGSLYLKSDMTFEVDGVLLCSSDVQDAGASAFTNSTKKFTPFININGTASAPLTNVRLTGTGTINGNGWTYRTPNQSDIEYDGDNSLTESTASNPQTVDTNGILAKNEYDYAMGIGDSADTAYGTRSNLVSGTHVNNLYIGGGLTLTNPANTTSGVSYCTNYVVNGIYAQSFNINNGDAVNVSRFQGFTVLNSVIHSGDDDIVMNAGNATDPTTGSAWIFDNYIARGHGGVAFGSGTTSWIDNVVAEDNIMVNTSDGLRCKSKPYSGGGARFVTFRDTAMKDLTNQVDGSTDGNVAGYQMDGCPFIFTTDYPVTPTVAGSAYSTAQDTSVSGQLSAVVANGAPLVFSKQNDPANGAVTVHSDGTFTYTPRSGFAGKDTFTFTAAAGSSISGAATETIQVNGGLPVEGKPTAAPAAFSTTMGTASLNGKLTGTAPAGGTLSFAPQTNLKTSGGGTVTVGTDGKFTYVPKNATYTGTDSFTFQTLNGTAASDYATVLICVNNAWPVFHDFEIGNCSVNGATTTGILNDGSPNALNYDLNFHNISFRNTSPLTLNYLSNSTFDHITFEGMSAPWAITNSTGLTFQNTVTTFTTDGSMKATSGLPTDGNVSRYTTNIDGSALSYAVAANPAHGSVTMRADGTFTYTSAGGYTGNDQFTFKATNSSAAAKGNNTDSNVSTVRIEVDKAAPGSLLIVAADGSGDYATITDAVAAVPANNTQPVRIFVKDGTYHEKVSIPADKPNITLEGSSTDGTVLTNGDCNATLDGSGHAMGTAGSATIDVESDHFTAQNITMENSYGPGAQAVAVHVKADHASFLNCKITGNQDTLYTDEPTQDGSVPENGVTLSRATATAFYRSYFKDCYIAGSVDYIFGPQAAVFDGCTLYSVGSGCVTAASTPINQNYGYVFRNCTVTGDQSLAGQCYFDRPWRCDANVTMLDCKIGSVIAPQGWSDAWGSPYNHETTRFYEIGSTDLAGAPLDMSGRASWSNKGADYPYQYTDLAHYSGAADYVDPGAYVCKNVFGNSNYASAWLADGAPATPVACAATYKMAEGGTFTGTLQAVSNTGDAVTFAKATNPQHGTVTVNGNGTFTYTPNSDYYGKDGFTFTAVNSVGLSDPASIQFNIAQTVSGAQVVVDDDFEHYTPGPFLPTGSTASTATIGDWTFLNGGTAPNLGDAGSSVTTNRDGHGQYLEMIDKGYTSSIKPQLTLRRTFASQTGDVTVQLDFRFQNISGFQMRTEDSGGNQVAQLYVSGSNLVYSPASGTATTLVPSIGAGQWYTAKEVLHTSSGTADVSIYNADGSTAGEAMSLPFRVAAANIGRFEFVTPGGNSSASTNQPNVTCDLDNFEVLIPAAPVITSQPASQTVTAGSSASFQVSATGGDLSYQWSRNGSPIAGATSAAYTIASAQTSDAGSYTVTVCNAAGSVTSAAATLTVNPALPAAPVITGQPTSQTVTAGSRASFQVNATGDGLSYQWNRDGSPITGATSAAYTIAAAQASDAGS